MGNALNRPAESNTIVLTKVSLNTASADEIWEFLLWGIGDGGDDGAVRQIGSRGVVVREVPQERGGEGGHGQGRDGPEGCQEAPRRRDWDQHDGDVDAEPGVPDFEGGRELHVVVLQQGAGRWVGPGEDHPRGDAVSGKARRGGADRGSIRKPEDVEEIVSAGGHIATIIPKVIRQMVFHPKTKETIREFDDARKELVAKNNLLLPTRSK